MSDLGITLGAVVVALLGLAGLSMWNLTRKGTRVERRRKAELREHRRRQKQLEIERASRPPR